MYLWLKLAHVLAVITFLGNIATGLFWHAHAARTRDPVLLAHTMAGIIRSDQLFTGPGVLVIIASGIGTALAGGIPIWSTDWVRWTILLFGVSGLVFVIRIAPLQRRLLEMARGAAPSFDFPSYRQRALQWEAWGAVALLTPLIGLGLMILKPDR